MSPCEKYRLQKTKNDEFYTDREVVENELQHYLQLIKGKKVVCPCDTNGSEFVKYLKDQNIEVTNFSGDFESVGFTNYDIIITNPPFSMKKEWYAKVIGSGKDFIFLAPITDVGIKFINELLCAGVLKFGVTSGSFRFNTPDGHKEVACCWFTSFDIQHLEHINRVPVNNLHYIDSRWPNVIICDSVKNVPDADVIGVPYSTAVRLAADYDVIGCIRPVINGVAKFSRVVMKKKEDK